MSKNTNHQIGCKHYDREEIDQSVFVKRIRCKDCGLYKCLECDTFFADEPIQPYKNLWVNFCSNRCMFTHMAKLEREPLAK